MEFPLVTVIIPAYNAEAYIAETLSSICNQSYQPLEIIVVDDGSTDDTAKIIRTQFAEVHYVHQKNSGSCAAPRNNGLTKATGQYITFLDADDRMMPGKIASQVEDLEGNPEAVMTVSNYQNFGTSKQDPDHFSTCPQITELLKKSHDQSLVIDSETCRSILIDENFTIAGSPMYRRSDLLEEKGFDVSLKACEDFHLNYRMAMRGPVIVNPRIGFERRMHDSNMSSDSERMLKSYIESRGSLMLHDSNPIFSEQLKACTVKAARSLQSCLVRKGKFKEAIRLYKKTFPPKSLGEIVQDLKQVTKILLLKLRAI